MQFVEVVKGCSWKNNEIETGRDFRHEGLMCLSQVPNDNKNHHVQAL